MFNNLVCMTKWKIENMVSNWYQNFLCCGSCYAQTGNQLLLWKAIDLRRILTCDCDLSMTRRFFSNVVVDGEIQASSCQTLSIINVWVAYRKKCQRRRLWVSTTDDPKLLLHLRNLENTFSKHLQFAQKIARFMGWVVCQYDENYII